MTLIQSEPKKILMWSPSKVPSEYQEVEWIGTTWTQWIDTWIFAYNNYQTETKIKVTTTSQNISIFGTVNSTDTYNHKYYHLTPYSNSWYFWTNNVEWHWWVYSPVIWTEYEIVYNNSNSYLNVNGSDIVSVSWTVGAPGSTLAIGRRWWWTLANPSYFNYYYFKVYDKIAWAYVMNFVPCYRIADGVIWMYDLIWRQFYTNAWTWTFTKWNDVTTPSNIEIQKVMMRPNWVEKQIRPDIWWQPWADTILYYDFEHTNWTTETNLAQTASIYDWIYSATPTIWVLATWKKYFNTQWSIYSATSTGFSTIDYNNSTVCIWLNPQDTQVKSYFGQSWWSTPWWWTSSWLGTIFCEKLSSWYYNVELWQTYGKSVSGSSIPIWNWTCLVMTDYNWTVTIYCNWTQVQQWTNPYLWNSNSTKFCVGSAYVYWAASPESRGVGNVWYGSVIIENKVRTSQEISDYYDQTKANYWL